MASRSAGRYAISARHDAPVAGVARHVWGRGHAGRLRAGIALAVQPGGTAVIRGLDGAPHSRNAFFVLCSGWTISAIVAAWVYALDATASLLTVPLLLVLILGGVANFFIWQRPSSPDPTSG